MRRLLTLVFFVVCMAGCRPSISSISQTVAPSETARTSPTPPSTAISTPDPSQPLPPGAVPPGEVLLHRLVADLDGDGEDELVVRTVGGDEEFATEAVGHVRILEPSGATYALGAELDVPSRRTFQPSFEVAQVRPDGSLGIVEQAPCGAHSVCMTLYTWDGTGYRAFAFASSAMGVAVNADGTILVGQRDAFTDPLTNTWTEVYRWDGGEYGLEEVTFEGQPYQGPAGAVRAYYNTINVCLSHGDLHAAYAYLSQGRRARHPYDDFWVGFADAVQVEVVGLSLVEETVDRATVEVSLVIVDRVGEQTEETARSITWRVIREEGRWKLDQAVELMPGAAQVELAVQLYRADPFGGLQRPCPPLFRKRVMC